MTLESLLVAILLGAVQGVLEWLPVSSEGNVALALAALGSSPAVAVRYALFLHLGTALAATAYYRGTLLGLFAQLSQWRPVPPSGERSELTFLAVATLVSGIVGAGSYLVLIDVVSRLAGGAFIAFIGALLVLTGVVQRAGADVAVERPRAPGVLDAVLVGVGQGVAILPGVSRSGTTVSALLLRGYDGETSFRLSFLLSIPAAAGAAAIAAVDAGIGLSTSSVAALAASAVVGYATLDVLVRVARRVAFWAVCVGLGVLAVVGGLLVMLG